LFKLKTKQLQNLSPALTRWYWKHWLYITEDNDQ